MSKEDSFTEYGSDEGAEAGLSAVSDDLRSVAGVDLRREVKGSTLTTFAIGGPLQYLVEIQTGTALCAAIRKLQSLRHGYRIIGAGSNLLIDDEGVPGFTIRLAGSFKSVDFRVDGNISAGGACSVMSLCRKAASAGLSGLEFAAGIPGSIGGSVWMNAGAHGEEIGALVEEVHGVTADGNAEVLPASALSFTYRSSGLPPGFIVTAVTLKLRPGDPESIRSTMRALLEERRSRQPLQYASAGSTFKNPSPTISAGYLIEAAGLKGFRQGGAEISAKHANWIINPNKTATCEDVRVLMRLSMDRVQERHGVVLEPELRLWPLGVLD